MSSNLVTILSQILLTKHVSTVDSKTDWQMAEQLAAAYNWLAGKTGNWSSGAKPVSAAAAACPCDTRAG